MPSLKVCSNRTPFAGDDIRVFIAAACLIRLLQLALACTLVAYTTKQENHFNELDIALLECEENGEFSPVASEGVVVMYMYAYVSICLSLVGLVAVAPMYYISKRGTPTDPEPRKALPVLCFFNFSVVNILRALGFAFGMVTLSVLQEYCDCARDELVFLGDNREACPGSNAWIGAVTTLAVTHGMDLTVASVEWLYLACNIFVPSRCCDVIPSESRWKASMVCCVGCSSIMSCCLFGGFQAVLGDFGDFALVISNYFNNNQILDITASDVVAGLIMVVRVQKERLLRTRQSIKLQAHTASEESPDAPNGLVQSKYSSDSDVSQVGDDWGHSGTRTPNPAMLASTSTFAGGSDLRLSTTTILSKRHVRERYLMAEAARYMPMAQGIYSWISYMLEYPLSGICGLSYLVLRRCACFFPSPKEKVATDYPWEPHMVSLQSISGFDSDRVVYATFKQTIAAVPYAIVLDHEWESVVVTIRGTLSMESVLADLAVTPAELTSLGAECGFEGEGRFCHRGMLASTQWIYRDLASHGKLKELFEGEYSHYRLRIVGHSLGAGCAAMLSVMLRKSYPSLRCLAFSPPGCLFSENLADECSEWVTSFVLDMDIVPRLSIQSFEGLRNDVLKMICRIKVPKYEIMNSSKTKAEDSELLSQDNDDLLYQEEEVKDSEFKRQVEEFFEYQAELKEKNNNSYTQLHPPGKIIQLLRTRRNNKNLHMPWFNSERKQEEDSLQAGEYTPRWVGREDLQSIILSSHFLIDHDPIRVKRKLQETAELNFGLKPPYNDVVLDDV